MSTTLLFTAGGALAAPPAPDLDAVNVTGTTPAGGTFAGQFDLARFAARSCGLVAIGDLTGTITNPDSTTTPVNFQDVALPVNVAQATCEILDLTLGPLHLDLLGLVIDLNQVHLRITAEQGPGNLLGNLLCGIAGLLDGDAPLNAIARLLNQLLGVLSMLG